MRRRERGATAAVIAERVDGAPMNSLFAVPALKYDYLHVIGNALADLSYFMHTWDVTCSQIDGLPAMTKEESADRRFP